MYLISAVLTAAIVAAGYYVAVSRLNEQYELGFEKKSGRISAKEVLVTGGLAFGMTGVLGVIRMSQFSFSMYLLILLLLWGMPVLAVTDYKKQIVPNRFLLLLILLWTAVVGIYLILDTGNGIALLFKSLAGAVAGGVIFLLCYLLSHKQLGAGDVKLVFVMGLYLTGDRIIGAIFYGTVICCIYSLVQLCRKKIGMKDGVPIVPFLYLGVLVTLFIL